MAAARACTLCADTLPLGPRPVLRAAATSRILIIGQAPGTKVHSSGIPWNDPSGIRLRRWMGVDDATFYDESRVAILPMGLCYPGVLPTGGDKPPMPICAPMWHPRIRPWLKEVTLTLAVGSYAITHLLRRKNMTDTVRDFQVFLPDIIPLPHPSWRTTGWEARNPWFGAAVLPVLRERVLAALS